MNKKTIKKALLLTVCAILLVVASVMGTLAYLTANDTVTNSFTVGKVKMTMDETDVDVYGVKDGEPRVETNDFIIVPGHKYIKDPTIHVEAGSEDSFIFVTVNNQIKDIETGTTIAQQMETLGWNEVPDVDGVYYKNYDKENPVQDHKVFEYFTINSALDNDDLTTYASAKVIVTAYAIQADGFGSNAKTAWTALAEQLKLT